MCHQHVSSTCVINIHVINIRTISVSFTPLHIKLHLWLTNHQCQELYLQCAQNWSKSRNHLFNWIPLDQVSSLGAYILIRYMCLTGWETKEGCMNSPYMNVWYNHRGQYGPPISQLLVMRERSGLPAKLHMLWIQTRSCRPEGLKLAKTPFNKHVYFVIIPIAWPNICILKYRPLIFWNERSIYGNVKWSKTFKVGNNNMDHFSKYGAFILLLKIGGSFCNKEEVGRIPQIFRVTQKVCAIWTTSLSPE